MTTNKQYRNEYISRINKVIDYIQNNLDAQLDLDTLANVAHFSKFHFHRIFSVMVGETLNSYINRMRIEKAASLLIVNSNMSITEVAFNYGYSGSAQFSRAFNKHFGMSASEYRNEGYKKSKIRKIESNIGKLKGKDSKAGNINPLYFDDAISIKIKGIKMKVKVKKLDDMTVAYIRHIGPYAGDSNLFGELFNKLYKWAGPRDLVNPPDTKTMSIYYDDPKITDESKLRMDVCLTIPENAEVSGEIGKMVITGGKYAVGRFELNADEYSAAWSKLMGEWFPESGYVPDDKPSFEMYQNNPEEHPEGKCIVDICVPVKPM